jgi:predicted amidohydrolase YtcJ
LKLDLLIRNANVMTMDPTHPAAHTVGVWNGVIAGLDGEVSDLTARGTIDAGGMTLLMVTSTGVGGPGPKVAGSIHHPLSG